MQNNTLGEPKDISSECDVNEISYYRSVDCDDFPVGQYILKQSGQPIKNTCRSSDELDYTSPALLEYVKTNGFKHLHGKDYVTTGLFFSNEYYVKKHEDGKMTIIYFCNIIHEIRRKKKPHIITGFTLYSNASQDDYQKMINELWTLGKKRKHKSNNIGLVLSTRSGYETATFELPKQKLDLELNYGLNFIPIHKKILSTLQQPKGKGLVLLHGAPGTGKTHYLKYLASQIKDKKVLFIPPHLIDFITSPEMTPFLINNSNSILFIEDAERVITDRTVNGGGAAGVSNILNLTDGILSDILNIQIVATFNMDKKKIDEALLRKGRLIAEHKFGKLTTIEANNLIKNLGYDFIANEPMTLTEIYNVGEEEYKTKETNKIGFLN